MPLQSAVNLCVFGIRCCSLGTLGAHCPAWPRSWLGGWWWLMMIKIIKNRKSVGKCVEHKPKKTQIFEISPYRYLMPWFRCKIRWNQYYEKEIRKTELRKTNFFPNFSTISCKFTAFAHLKTTKLLQNNTYSFISVKNDVSIEWHELRKVKFTD